MLSRSTSLATPLDVGRIPDAPIRVGDLTIARLRIGCDRRAVLAFVVAGSLTTIVSLGAQPMAVSDVKRTPR
jgi:hypothetical protein